MIHSIIETKDSETGEAVPPDVLDVIEQANETLSGMVDIDNDLVSARWQRFKKHKGSMWEVELTILYDQDGYLMPLKIEVLRDPRSRKETLRYAVSEFTRWLSRDAMHRLREINKAFRQPATVEG